MTLKHDLRRSHHKGNGESELSELGYILQHCWDLAILQMSKLTQLPSVVQRAMEETDGLELAKALRKELIACAEQITQRSKYPIGDIISAIEKERLGLDSQNLARIQGEIGIPLPRNKIDLARYYTLRLIMEGIDRETIADFLDVDLRTVANYVAQAKEHVRLTLESRFMT